MTEVRLSILMGSVNIFAQQEDIVGREKHTKLVMTVLAVELQLISNANGLVLLRSVKENVPEDGASVNGINGGMERNAGQEPKLIVVKWGFARPT